MARLISKVVAGRGISVARQSVQEGYFLARARIHQDMSHHLRRQTKEMSPILPSGLLTINQVQVSLIDQRRGLQGVAGVFPQHVAMGQTMELPGKHRQTIPSLPICLPRSKPPVAGSLPPKTESLRASVPRMPKYTTPVCSSHGLRKTCSPARAFSDTHVTVVSKIPKSS